MASARPRICKARRAKGSSGPQGWAVTDANRRTEASASQVTTRKLSANSELARRATEECLRLDPRVKSTQLSSFRLPGDRTERKRRGFVPPASSAGENHQTVATRLGAGRHREDSGRIPHAATPHGPDPWEFLLVKIRQPNKPLKRPPLTRSAAWRIPCGRLRSQLETRTHVLIAWHSAGPRRELDE